jgi:ubiquinone/menaquinone biosynthesis C-methylase UbiE
VSSAGEQGSHDDAVRSRFSQTAAAVGRCSDAHAEELAARVRHLVELTGDERALDAGAGTGALAFALSPLVREVVALEVVPELLEEGRKRLEPGSNVTFVDGDVNALPFPDGSFDVVGCRMVLHHVARPELVMAELARVTGLGGTLLVIDQLAPIDPMEAIELNRFESARDPSHARVLSDQDFRGLFEQNSLVLIRSDLAQEERQLDAYLDLAGCVGEERARAEAMAPGRGTYTATVGWYVLQRRPYGSSW